MPDQIYIGNFAKGLKTNPLPFNIDNDAFPTLYNAYCWRGRIKRKRGTVFLARLQRQISSVLNATPPLVWQEGDLALVAGAVNIITGFSLEVGSSIVPGSVSFVVGANTYTEPTTPNGTLVGAPGGSGTINYATGAVTISGGAAGPLTGTFSYYPDLPVLGLEDVVSNSQNTEFPLLQAFDSKYSYQINQVAKLFFYATNYYKISNVPFAWSNTDDNQFWSTNYQSAFWVTNNKPGLHLVNGAYVSGSGTNVVTFTFTYPSYHTSSGLAYENLIAGDKLWFNEWPAGSTINGNTNVDTNGTVSLVVNAATGTYQVTFPGIETVSGNGIAQLLTNSLSGQDGIKWYDGDPTGGTGLPTITGLGWVNFAPPLTALTTTINDQRAAKYYLVGALAIVAYKDRLLFFGAKIQSSGGDVIEKPLQDTVIWSWNGTPYYNSLVPTNLTNSETFDVRAYYVDQAGFGGYLSAGISQPIKTVISNEDVLLVGFGGTGNKTRFVYTGNDLQPFLFYLINSELPSSCTFSAITMDRGGLEIGTYGITLTTQQSCQRIDLDIPDSVFEIQFVNNGQNRVNAIRDFFREWVYFSYPIGDGNEEDGSWVYPIRTFMFNYRDNTWAIFKENFTHHGLFRKTLQYTWSNPPFTPWSVWRESWASGSSQALFPDVIAGNPQGYVLSKDEGTGEGISGAISAILDNGLGMTQITSYNHCVEDGSPLDVPSTGDYLLFSGSIGSTYLNGLIGLVTAIIDVNNFIIDIPYQSFTYLGLGSYTRLSQPLIQTKQFPFYWEQGRQMRLGVQKYLLDRTSAGQVTVNINLSQDSETAWNQGPIIPDPATTNKSLIYSQLMYTCPESTNMGLTPANTNLQMPTAANQFQIWHRINTSLIGNSVQIGITLSNLQMRDLALATNEIALHGIHLTFSPGPLLS